jgi:hypothetical protein
MDWNCDQNDARKAVVKTNYWQNDRATLDAILAVTNADKQR